MTYCSRCHLYLKLRTAHHWPDDRRYSFTLRHTIVSNRNASLYPGWSTEALTHRLLRCQTGTKQARYRALCAPVNVPEQETKRPTDAHEGRSEQERPRLEHRTRTGKTECKTRGITRSQVCTQTERRIEIAINSIVWATSHIAI